MSDVLGLVLMLGGLILLDVLALRFGVDSRDGMRPDWPDADGAVE